MVQEKKDTAWSIMAVNYDFEVISFYRILLLFFRLLAEPCFYSSKVKVHLLTLVSKLVFVLDSDVEEGVYCNLSVEEGRQRYSECLEY